MASLPRTRFGTSGASGRRADREALYLGSVSLSACPVRPFDRREVRRAAVAALELEDIARRSGHDSGDPRIPPPAPGWSPARSCMSSTEGGARAAVRSGPACHPRAGPRQGSTAPRGGERGGGLEPPSRSAQRHERGGASRRPGRDLRRAITPRSPGGKRPPLPGRKLGQSLRAPLTLCNPDCGFAGFF